jgi:hypothetical protein
MRKEAFSFTVKYSYAHLAVQIEEKNEIVRHDSQFTGQDSNRAPAENKSEALHLQLTGKVEICALHPLLCALFMWILCMGANLHFSHGPPAKFGSTLRRRDLAEHNVGALTQGFICFQPDHRQRNSGMRYLSIPRETQINTMAYPRSESKFTGALCTLACFIGHVTEMLKVR